MLVVGVLSLLCCCCRCWWCASRCCCRQFEFYEPTVFYPLLYVHGVYSNMIDKLARPFVTSWSFYVQSGTQQLLIVRAEPVFIAVDEEVVQQSLTGEQRAVFTPLAVDDDAGPSHAETALGDGFVSCVAAGCRLTVTRSYLALMFAFRNNIRKRY